jgi:DNA-damage-inducible protein J
MAEVFAMSKSTNLYVRIEPDLKENAETILKQLGIPMSNAVGMFLKQVVLRRGMPFDLTLPASHPLDISMLTEEEFHAELEKGYADIEKGNVRPVRDAFASLRGELGI